MDIGYYHDYSWIYTKQGALLDSPYFLQKSGIKNVMELFIDEGIDLNKLLSYIDDSTALLLSNSQAAEYRSIFKIKDEGSNSRIAMSVKAVSEAEGKTPQFSNPWFGLERIEYDLPTDKSQSYSVNIASSGTMAKLCLNAEPDNASFSLKEQFPQITHILVHDYSGRQIVHDKYFDSIFGEYGTSFICPYNRDDRQKKFEELYDAHEDRLPEIATLSEFIKAWACEN